MEYSAVIQPPPTPCSFIHLGTDGSMVAAQMTWVFPVAIKTDPSAFGAISAVNRRGRSWSFERPASLASSNGESERFGMVITRPDIRNGEVPAVKRRGLRRHESVVTE